jgi:hypothetical protein
MNSSEKISLPFRYGSFKFNVSSFYSYELSKQEMDQLKQQMKLQGRKIKLVDLDQALEENLKPSTRKALEFFISHTLTH